MLFWDGLRQQANCQCIHHDNYAEETTTHLVCPLYRQVKAAAVWSRLFRIRKLACLLANLTVEFRAGLEYAIRNNFQRAQNIGRGQKGACCSSPTGSRFWRSTGY